MKRKFDAELLREYAEHGDESAFTEIVIRYTNLVYSAALRQVDSPDVAAEVTQKVFIGLARGAQALAPRLTENAPLAGWLCRSTRNITLKLRRDEYRRHSRERQAMETLNSTSDAASDWESVRTLLDEAMSQLSESDYDAVVLRFFDNQDLRSVGRALGVSDDTAQKRVSRTLDKLREYLRRRGITTTSASLSLALSTNAVQAAPAGLAITISSIAIVGVPAVQTSTAIAATKAIAMITFQKTLIAAIITVAIGGAIYEARQASISRTQVRAFQEQQSQQFQQLQDERDSATRQLAALRDENERLNRNTAELLRLRAEVSRFRQASKPVLRSLPDEEQDADARNFYESAIKHHTAHEYEQELDDLNKAIQLAPNYIGALFSRASLYYGEDLPKQKRDAAKAVADYDRLIELKGNNVAYRHNRALCYEQLRQYDQAIADYTAIVEGDTDFSHLVDGREKQLALDYHYRGRAYHWYKKDFAQAIVDYTEALRLDPNSDMVHQHRGQCFEALGQNDKAQEDFAAEKARNN